MSSNCGSDAASLFFEPAHTVVRSVGKNQTVLLISTGLNTFSHVGDDKRADIVIGEVDPVVEFEAVGLGANVGTLVMIDTSFVGLTSMLTGSALTFG